MLQETVVLEARETVTVTTTPLVTAVHDESGRWRCFINARIGPTNDLSDTFLSTSVCLSPHNYTITEGRCILEIELYQFVDVVPRFSLSSCYITTYCVGPYVGL